MNQHERVEQALAEHDAQAERTRHIVAALDEIEECICLFGSHLERSLGSDFEARAELTPYLDRMRRAIARVEADV